MFTGLIEEMGRVASIRLAGGSARLSLGAPGIGPGSAIGDSVAINGVCLTVVERSSGRLEFEAIQETLRRSSLGTLRPGDRVNLERAMGLQSRFGGHIVQGHVDTLGHIQEIVPEGTSRLVTIAAPEIMRYVVEKGSIAVDGISLTVAAVTAAAFTVAIIPHTWSVTTLQDRRAGDPVNLEADILAKYVERLLEARLGASLTDTGGLTEAALREHGFA